MPRGKHGNHVRGSAHTRWNAGVVSSDSGYLRVQVGVLHPLADPNGYAYVHLLVWVAAGNARPGIGEVIHHENEDKQDNRIENLRLMSRGEHNRHHNASRVRGELGRFVGDDERHTALPESADVAVGGPA